MKDLAVQHIAHKTGGDIKLVSADLPDGEVVLSPWRALNIGTDLVRAAGHELFRLRRIGAIREDDGDAATMLTGATRPTSV